MAALLDIIKKGSVDRSVTIRIIDSTDGTPETGVLWNTAGIDLWYRREGAAVTSITEATLATLTTAHTDGGFLHISNGEYRLDIPDAAFAAGANYVDFGGTVTGMVVIGGRVRLTDFDLDTANVTLATAQPAITFQPMTITAADGIANITLSGSGSADGLAFTRSGSGGLYDTSWAAAVQQEASDALTAYDPPTLDELIAVAQLLVRSDAAIATDRAAILTLINANEGTGAGAFDNTTDSTQALEAAIPTVAEIQSGLATTANLEARTPTSAELAYIVSNAKDGLPVTFTGGTTTTAILGNVDGAAASTTNDVYNGRILVFNAGTLNQQVTDITDYDGATKTATITAVTTAVTASHTANMK